MEYYACVLFILTATISTPRPPQDDDEAWELNVKCLFKRNEVKKIISHIAILSSRLVCYYDIHCYDTL